VIDRNAGKGRIKSGGKQYKISEIQVFAGTALYLFLSETVRQTPEFVGQFAAFLCCSCLNLLRLVMAVLD